MTKRNSMKRYIQPETEIVTAEMQQPVAWSTGQGTESDPIFDGARQQSHFFEEEEEDYEEIPLFTVKHKSLWE